MPIRPENRQRYPSDWKLRSRFIRHFRAKNRCELCDAKNHEPHPVTGSKVILTTALRDLTNVTDAFREGCEVYLVKPIERQKLVKELEGLDLIPVRIR